MESERRARSIKKTTECIRLFLSFWAPLFYPFHSFSYPCCIPLVVISLPPLLSYSFSLSLSLSARAVAFSTAGPHPHTQCGCYPVLYSPVHCNSATMNTTLLVHTYNAPLQWVECANREEGGPRALLDWFILWCGSYHLSSSMGWRKGEENATMKSGAWRIKSCKMNLYSQKW